jgi:Sel1 repeat-containing protein
MMRTGKTLLIAAVIAASPVAVNACGWWGENIEDDSEEALVIEGPGLGIDLFSPEGMAQMSRDYRLGQNVPQDDTLARQWAHRAATAGHAGAMNDYAQYLEQGVGGPVDMAEAAKWYSAGAEAGNVNAQHSLANMYIDGRGVTADAGKAEFWLRKAAIGAHPDAVAELAESIWTGAIEPAEPAEACLWWQVATSLGKTPDSAMCQQATPPLSDETIRDFRQRADTIIRSATREPGT